MARLRWKRVRAVLSRGLSLLAALGLLIGAVQIPSPSPASDGAFPCQGHPCGCRGGMACWLGCCCYSPAERLAWAQKHGVRPPDAFLNQFHFDFDLDSNSEGANLDEEIPTIASGDGESGHACCHHESDCCAAGGTAACQRADGGCDDDESDPEHPLLLAGVCHGLGHWWIASGQPLGLPIPRVGWRRSDREIAVTILDAAYESNRDQPAVPPG